MRIGTSLLFTALVLWIVAPAACAGEENAVDSPDFVIMSHMKGSLAFQVSSVNSVWYVAANDGSPAKLRLVSTSLSEAKAVSGDEADRTWLVFADREDFLVMDHMGGRLAIPRAQVRTAYFTEDGGPRLRLVYDGDPSGKVLDGDEAARVWAELRP